MCGIVGYCDKNGGDSAASLAFKALKQLEYRGYDSAGMATLCDDKLLMKKGSGELDIVNREHKLGELRGNIAIGHTRWATHGGVTQVNAHPHLDCTGTMAVVHNGIIENFQELRQELTNKGHKFRSETDTEIIPHLLEDELQRENSLERAVLAIISKLEGSYSFLALSSHDPNKIVGIRKGSPLVIGLNDEGYFIASDTLALSESATETITLGEAEIVVLEPNAIKFFDANGNKLVKEVREIDAGWNNGHKDGYPFYMLKEIMEQPQALRYASDQDEKQFTRIALNILRTKNVVITACGSSRYAALIGRYLFSRIGKKFCDVVMASEFQYFADSVDKNTLVLAVSQSGETADVLEGVKMAKAAGAEIISIVNRPNSMLCDLSDHVIHLNCGPELCVAATKTFLSQLAVFYLLAFSLVGSFSHAAETLKNMSHKIMEMIDWNDDTLKTLAWDFKHKDNFYYIARGINFAIASEGALKLKEISYIHAEGMPAGELKHGSLALIEKGTPVVTICPQDYTYNETLSNAIEAKSRGACIIAVSDKVNSVYDRWIKIPKVDELYYPLFTVVPLQMLAYHMAIERGCDPDKPRNLAKSVTVK